MAEMRALAREQRRSLHGEVLVALREDVKQNTPEQKGECKGSKSGKTRLTAWG